MMEHKRINSKHSNRSITRMQHHSPFKCDQTCKHNKSINRLSNSQLPTRSSKSGKKQKSSINIDNIIYSFIRIKHNKQPTAINVSKQNNRQQKSYRLLNESQRIKKNQEEHYRDQNQASGKNQISRHKQNVQKNQGEAQMQHRNRSELALKTNNEIYQQQQATEKQNNNSSLLKIQKQMFIVLGKHYSELVKDVNELTKQIEYFRGGLNYSKYKNSIFKALKYS